MMRKIFPITPLRRFGLLATAAVLIAACSPLGAINALSERNDIAQTSGVAYGPGARHKLDLYAPDDAAGPLPTVLFLYGGSWKRGARADYAFAGRALAQAGFLVAVADYRTYPDVRFPAFVDDAAAAAAWLSKNAPTYGGLGGKVHLIGHSAGAHIAALLALDPKYMARAGASRAMLGRWVGLAGPYAFHPSEIASVRDIFAGIENQDAARPITFAGPHAPPALLLHGDGDGTVYPSNSRQLAKALGAAGSTAFVHIYPGVGHGPLVVALSPSFDWIAPALADTVRFLETGEPPISGAAAATPAY